MAPCILYHSRRLWLLCSLQLVVTAQAALVIWLVSLASVEAWRAELGSTFWWVVPAALIGLSLILPAAVAWLHGRYVLRLTVEGDTVHATLFLWWGTSSQQVPRDQLSQAALHAIAPGGPAPAWRAQLPSSRVDWLLDRQADFPRGEDAVVELFQPHAK